LLAVKFGADEALLIRIIREFNLAYPDHDTMSGNDDNDDDNDDNTAVIVGVTVGCAAAVLVIIMGVLCYLFGLRRAKFR